MIQANAGTFLWVIVLGVLLFSKIKSSFYFLTISSCLTTVAVFTIGKDCILVFQVVFLLCCLKFVFAYRGKITVTVDKWLYVFVLWCLITIPFSFLHHDTFVHNIDGKTTYVRFSLQQISQYMYLLIGIITCTLCNIWLSTETISLNSVWRCFKIAYVLSLCLALFQHVLPLDFVNSYFRNKPGVGYNFEGSRISGPFSEPSMLALYCAPLFGGYLYKFLTKRNLEYLLLSLLFIIVILDNNGSSGVIGIIASIIIITLIEITTKRNIKSTVNKLILFVFIAGCIYLVCRFSGWKMVVDSFNGLVGKLNGEGLSGGARMESVLYHFKVGIGNIIPTGFGTVRSYDMFTSWLCSIGILGIALYCMPVIGLCVKLFKLHTNDSLMLLICIVVHNVIMFISVPEFGYLSIWIMYGMGFYLINIKEKIYMNHQVKGTLI